MHGSAFTTELFAVKHRPYPVVEESLTTSRMLPSILKSGDEAVHVCKLSVEPTVELLRETHIFVAYSCSFEVEDHTHVCMGLVRLQFGVTSKTSVIGLYTMQPPVEFSCSKNRPFEHPSG